MGAFYPLHQGSEAANSLPPMKDIEIEEFCELIGVDPPKSANKQAKRQEKEQKKAAKHVFGTLDAFTDVLKSSLKDLGETKLDINQRGDYAHMDHPTGTRARPDVVIFNRDYSSVRRENSSPQDRDKNVLWGSIEMAIEYRSVGKSREQRLKRATTYVGYVLQARPDLVSALGLLVDFDSFDFFFCNADGIKKLSLSKQEDYLPLLSAVVKYLHGGQKKNLDSTLVRLQVSARFDVLFPNEGTSTPASGGTIYPSCYLRYSHDPFGRRPNIFIYKPANGVSGVRVIKDQYIRGNRRWDEKDILEKIHAQGTYPAVVRMRFFNTITEPKCGSRIRVRMGLQDYGDEFLSLKTPREIIYALYDLLEVTRGLYFDRKVLHRDISPWNIMVRKPGHIEDIETCPSTSPVFIRHLLNPQEPKHKSSIFLIDFGYGRDLDSSQPRGNGRTGTPMFIARAVQAGQPLPPWQGMYFPSLPLLSEGIKAAYESNHPRRVKLFNGAFTPQIGPSKNPPPTSPFEHKLGHDGESGTWCSFWPLFQASPENEAEVSIEAMYWNALMPRYDGPRTGLPKFDNRGTILRDLVVGVKNIFHPGYEGLLSLFQSIAIAIVNDYHWAEDSIRQQPDFIHEILQRIILNFVVENKDASFMDKKIAEKNRKVEGATSRSHLSTHETGSRRASSISGQGVKRKQNKTTSGAASSKSLTPAVE